MSSRWKFDISSVDEETRVAARNEEDDPAIDIYTNYLDQLEVEVGGVRFILWTAVGGLLSALSDADHQARLEEAERVTPRHLVLSAEADSNELRQQVRAAELLLSHPHQSAAARTAVSAVNNIVDALTR